jgi:hypothetical protein
MTWRKKLEDRA